jgi:hypothetical protein
MTRRSSLHKRLSANRHPSGRRGFRPVLSVLEGRTLLAVFSWLNAVDGAFNNAANWINQDGQHGVPGAGDTADITYGDVTVTVPASTSVDNLQCVGTLDVTSGTFSVANVVQSSSTVGNLILPSGTTFATNAGTTSLNSGNLSGTLSAPSGAVVRLEAGAVTVNSGSVFSGAALFKVTGGTVTLNANVTAPGLFEVDGGTITGPGALTIPSSFTWTGGTLDGPTTTTIGANATLAISGGNNKFLTGSHILTINGTATWTGVGEFDGGPGSTVNNNGKFNVQSDTNFANGGDGAGMIFNNAGTFTKSNTSGTTMFAGNVLNNSGTVQVQSGTLLLLNGGSNTGTFNISSGATLFFDGGTETVSGPNAQLVGTGLYELANGTLTFNAGISIANLTVNSGTLNGPGTVAVTSAFNWTGGSLDGAGATNIASNATLAISGGNPKFLSGSHILNNNGAATWSGVGEFDGSPGSTVNNNGTFTVASDTTFGNGGDGGGMIFNNPGTFTKTGSSGTTTFAGNVLNNSGTLNLNSGSLSLQNGGTNTGTLNVAAGSTVVFTGGTETVAGSGVLAGQGLYELTSGALTITPNIGVANLTVTGGTLNGAGTLTIATAFNWSGGDLDGGGTTTVGPGATLTISGAATKFLTGSHILNNNGAGTWSGVGEFDGSPGSTVNNNGSFTATSDTRFGNGGAGAGMIFNNSGTFTKSGSAGITDFNGNALNNSGTVKVESGTLELDSGGALLGPFSISAGALLNLNGGSFPLSGTAVAFTGAGGVEFSGGAITTGPTGATLTLAPTTALQWNGGAFQAPIGATLTFKGALQLVGSNDEVVGGGGTFDLIGTLTQTGTGNLVLNGSSSGTTSTTFEVPAGSTYNFASNSGVKNGGNSGGIIANAGTIEKTAGIGTSIIGSGLNNSAAIVVNTGTLALATAGGTNTGGSFSVAGGAVLDLTGGSTVSYGGTFTGSGAGQIQLNSGTIQVVGGSVGATFNFPTGLFVWSGGTINTNRSPLNIPSTGTVQVTGLNGESLTGGGTLNIAGKVAQTGVGSLTIGGGATLNIQSGGSFNLQSNAAIPVGNGGGLVAVSAGGTFSKSAGTSTATVSATVSNSGAIQVSSGTLDFTGTVDQFTGGALTGGTWVVTSTPSSEAAVTFNMKPITTLGVAASVTMSGANSTFPGFSSMSTNKGALSLLGGKSFFPLGALTNLGSITLGPGSLLGITGAFNEASTAKLTVQIGGTNASPTTGAVQATGAINLAGALVVTDPSGVTPPVGNTLTLIHNLGTNFVNGTFAGLPGGTAITVNGMTFTIFYRKGASGRDVVLERTK